MQGVLREVSVSSGSRQQLVVGDRLLEVDLSGRAGSRLIRRRVPLLVELEILFGCLVRKRVNFRDLTDEDDALVVNEKLSIIVRPVLYELCAPQEGDGSPCVVDMPVVDTSRLIPHHLEIDYEDGEWVGSFSFV